MEKTIKRPQTNRGDHLVAVFELGDKRGHRKGGRRRSSRFCVQANFRIPDIRAVRRDRGVIAFIEDGAEIDRRGHKLHMGRNVLWKMIRVASLRRQDALALRLNFNPIKRKLTDVSLPPYVRINVVLGLQKAFCLLHRRVSLNPDFGQYQDSRRVDSFLIKPVADSIDRFGAWGESGDDLFRGPMVSEVGGFGTGDVEEHFVETIHVGLLKTKAKRQDL